MAMDICHSEMSAVDFPFLTDGSREHGVGTVTLNFNQTPLVEENQVAIIKTA